MIEIPGIRFSNRLRHVAFGNALQRGGGHDNRRDERLNQRVHAAHQIAPAAFKRLGVAALRQFPGLNGLDEVIHFAQQVVQAVRHQIQRLHQPVVRRAFLDFDIQIAVGDFLS